MRKMGILLVAIIVILSTAVILLAPNVSVAFDSKWVGQEIVISDSSDEHNVRNITMDSITGGDIYVLWDEIYTTNREIHISYSHDGGSTWSSTNEDRIISYQNDNDAVKPSVAVSPKDGYIYAVWQEKYEGHWQILFGKSTDGGSTWSSTQGDTIITNPGHPTVRDNINPKIAVDNGGTIHLIWIGYNVTINQWEAYYGYSKDGGTTWSSQSKYIEVSDHTITGDVKDVDIVVNSSNNIYAFWTKPMSGAYEVFVSVSTDGGTSWRYDTVSYPDGYDAQNISACVGKDTIVVIWEEFAEEYGSIEIFHSTYDGASWSGQNGDELISYPDRHDAHHPSITYTDDNIYHAVWYEYDENTGLKQIFYSNSTDGGFKWSSFNNFIDYILTKSSYDDYNPVISPGAGGDFYIAWREWTESQTKQKGSDEVHFMSVPGNVYISEIHDLYAIFLLAVIGLYGIRRKR